MQQVVGIGVRDELHRLRQVDDATIILPVTRVSSSSGSRDRVSPGRQESDGRRGAAMAQRTR